LSCYGNRFFISLTPVFILGLYRAFSAFFPVGGKTSRAWRFRTAILLLVLWNIVLFSQWGTAHVPGARGISCCEMTQ